LGIENNTSLCQSLVDAFAALFPASVLTSFANDDAC
jgi:hypothetical protein